MPIKIIALDGLNNAKMCKLMGPLLQTIPGVDYANIDYLSQKLTLQISGRDNARIIESVTEKLKKNMPDVSIRYAQANDVPEDPNKIPMPKVKRGDAPPPNSSGDRRSNLQEKAKRVQEAQKTTNDKVDNLTSSNANENMAKALTSLMHDDIPQEKSSIELDNSLGELNTEKLAQMEEEVTNRVKDYEPEQFEDEVTTIEDLKNDRQNSDLPSPDELKRQEQSQKNREFAESIVEELEKSKRAERAREKARADARNSVKAEEPEPIKEEPVVKQKEPRPPKPKKVKVEKTQEKPSLFASPAEDDNDDEEDDYEPFVPIIHTPSPTSKEDDIVEEFYDDEEDDYDDYEDELDELIDEEYLERQRELEEYENSLKGEKIGFIKKIINRIGKETFTNTNGLIFTMIAFAIIFLLDLPEIVDLIGRLICFSFLSIYALISDHSKFKFSSWLSAIAMIVPCGLMFLLGNTTQAILAMALYNVALIVAFLYYIDFNMGIRRAIDISPRTLIKVHEDICEELPFNAIKPDDEIIINEGEVVPFDCLVINGESDIDDSFITGNSELTPVTMGSWISCGSVNVTSSLQLKVSKNQEKSVMAVIRRTFMNDSSDKLNTVSICKSYVSLLFFIQVFMILALTAIMVLTQQYDKIIDFLVISALLLAPTGINASIVHMFKGTLGKALKKRITIISSTALEELSKVTSIIVGHNEVLNTGVFDVISVKVIDPKVINEEKLLELAASTEAKVDSPISNAIVEYYTKNYNAEIDSESITSCEPFKEGIKAIFDLSYTVLVGSYGFMIQHNVLVPENTTERVCIYVAKQNTYVGSIYLEAKHREGYETFTSDLRKYGVKNIMLLTGNETAYAEGYGRRNGYSTILSQRTLNDKINTISTLVGAQDKLGNIAYIGTHEEVDEFTKRRCPCISVGKTSFAKTLHSARALIPTSNLSQIVETIKIARSVRTNCFMSIAASYILKYAMIAAVYFLNIPFFFASLVISGLIVFEALIAHHSLGEEKYGDVKSNNEDEDENDNAEDSELTQTDDEDDDDITDTSVS